MILWGDQRNKPAGRDVVLMLCLDVSNILQML